jgi:putative membrane protein
VNPKELISNAARGFAMGAADIVPGVSGGTIALILGIYERLIASIRTGARSLGRAARGDIRGFIEQLKAIEWTLIGPLLIGIGAAVLALSSILHRLLTDEPQAMAGLFFGLVVASILISWKLLGERDSLRIAVLAVVAVIAFFVLGLQSGAATSPPMIAFFFSGAIAICAMILPGISGSFLLLMIGMYSAFIAAVHDREISQLAVFGIGALVGLALFSTLLSWVLEHHRDTLLAGLIGLMAGSLRVLWPWPNGVGAIEEDVAEQVDGTVIEWPSDFGEVWLPIVLAVAAFAVVMALDSFAPSTD